MTTREWAALIVGYMIAWAITGVFDWLRRRRQYRRVFDDPWYAVQREEPE